MSLVATIHDGHTEAAVDNFVMPLILKQIVPFGVEIVDSALEVTKCHSEHCQIPVGARILSVNGIPTDELLVRMRELISYDSDRHRDYALALLFPAYFGILTNFHAPEVTYETGDGQLSSEVVKSSFTEKLAFLQNVGSTQQAPYSYKVIADSVGYIDFRSFADLEAFRIFTSSTFRTIRENEIRHLVIDIRRNSGGNSRLGDELLQYISPTAFAQFDSGLVKVSEASAASGFGPSERIGEMITNRGSPIPLRENPYRFDGNAYLLTSAYTFSSAQSFAAAFKCVEVGLILGEETGGNTVSYGEQLAFTTPKMGVNFRVSCKKWYSACGADDGRGVIPDISIEGPLHEAAGGTDAVLDSVLASIRNPSATMRRTEL